MFCCRPSRRDLMRWGVAVAGFSMLSGSAPTPAARSVRPVNLELVTLTETSAVLTWYTGLSGTDDGLGRYEPASADGVVAYGTHPARLDRFAHQAGDTPYHHVELDGLEPGRTYYYQARSRGRPASASRLIGGRPAGVPVGEDIYAFTTPQPPPGRFLFSVALCNDLHVGEAVSGMIGGLPFPKGIGQPSGRPPYAELMAEAVVADARARGATYLLAAGDVSAESAPADVGMARKLLDGFGTHDRDYFVVRGNHDRAHTGAEHASCRPGRWQGNDCFADAFSMDVPHFARDLHGLRIIGLDTYDKAGNGGDAGGLSRSQIAWFAEELRKNPDQPTVVFGHHPLVTPRDPVSITGGRSLASVQAAGVQQLYRRAPGVFLHHAGHTHRNYRTVIGDVVHQEVGAAKEYPGGFSLLRVHSGGYALNFYKTRSDLAREWSERSRMEFWGMWPHFSLGSRALDRNSVVARDLSGITRPSRS